MDKPTHIVLSKRSHNSEELPGALLQVVDKDGNVVEEWISTDQPHEIVAKLVVDESYVLREVRPADGWAYAEDVPFKVSHDGTVDMSNGRQADACCNFQTGDYGKQRAARLYASGH